MTNKVLTKSTMIWELSGEEFESDEYQDKLGEYFEEHKELASKYGITIKGQTLALSNKLCPA